jgi:cobalamin biosynthesis Mg chelatase CobN
MPEGMTPAIQYYFYPTDLTGKEFIYPKDQALKIAAATHQAVLATDSDATTGGEAHVFRVEPNGAESQYDANATASTENTNATSEPQPSSSASSSTASLNSQADVNNSPASGPPAYSTAANDRGATAANDQGATATSGTSSENNRATGTSGAYDQNQNASPRQQASAELPRTASPLPLFGLIGLMALAAGFGLRLARSTY